MEQQATQEVSPQDVSESSQTQQQDTPVENGATDKSALETKEEEGRIPMSRWNQKLKAERELKARVQKYESDFQKYQKAIEFHEALSQDPRKLEAIMKVLNANETIENKDPYSDYEPEVAERFRKLDELEKWKASLEEREKAREMQTVTSHKQNLEDEFSQLLLQDGHMDKEGNFDEGKVNLISKATLATLLEIAQNPDLPTKAELKEAYKLVTQGLSSLSKSTLTKVVKHNVPPSGSKSGSAMSSGGKMTEAQRIAQIANELG